MIVGLSCAMDYLATAYPILDANVKNTVPKEGIALPLNEQQKMIIELQDRITMMGLEIDWKTAKLYKFEKRNQKLVEALEFYANEKLWAERVCNCAETPTIDCENFESEYNDPGNHARKALADKERK